MTDEIDDAKLAALIERTRKLPRELEPPADAWVAIKSEIEKPSTKAVPSIGSGRNAIWQRPAFLAAAAVFLVAASSLITAGALARYNRSAHEIAVAPSPKARTSSTEPRTMAEFAAVEASYISSANELSSILETGKTTLSPETVEKLRKSLAIIDQAIVEARRALAADPANRALIDVLNTTYNQKLDLLRRTTEMGRS
jgi:hypothetical protein